jgi:hypothetical protein
MGSQQAEGGIGILPMSVNIIGRMPMPRSVAVGGRKVRRA